MSTLRPGEIIQSEMSMLIVFGSVIDKICLNIPPISVVATFPFEAKLDGVSFVMYLLRSFVCGVTLLVI